MACPPGEEVGMAMHLLGCHFGSRKGCSFLCCARLSTGTVDRGLCRHRMRLNFLSDDRGHADEEHNPVDGLRRNGSQGIRRLGLPPHGPRSVWLRSPLHAGAPKAHQADVRKPGRVRGLRRGVWSPRATETAGQTGDRILAALRTSCSAEPTARGCGCTHNCVGVTRADTACVRGRIVPCVHHVDSLSTDYGGDEPRRKGDPCRCQDRCCGCVLGKPSDTSCFGSHPLCHQNTHRCGVDGAGGCLGRLPPDPAAGRVVELCSRRDNKRPHHPGLLQGHPADKHRCLSGHPFIDS
mmetsp:Transcript_6690/g.18728  ORF Transcript_6690/g.18728 Transcript_6690/m.18728 type:complete len:294 (-) Transcript_6690:979-1860(-)